MSSCSRVLEGTCSCGTARTAVGDVWAAGIDTGIAIAPGTLFWAEVRKCWDGKGEEVRCIVVASELCRAAASFRAVGKASSISVGMFKALATAAAANESPPASKLHISIT